MIVKECNNCGSEFNAGRSDAKYCNATCRNQAHNAKRKSETATVVSQLQDKDNITIPKSEYQALIRKSDNSRSSGSQGAYQGLLKEKDNTGDLKALLSEYKMKLFFLEDKLKDRNNEISDLNRQLATSDKEYAKLEKSVDQKDMGIISKMIENNPEIIPMCLEKATPILEALTQRKAINTNAIPTVESPIGTVVDHAIQKSKVMTKENLKPSKPEADYNESETLEMAEVIKDQLAKLSKLYPDHRVDSVLALIVDAVEKNKTMIDSFILK